MIAPSDPRVSEAVVIWTGFGRRSFPSLDESRVEQRFGDLATDLISLVRGWYYDFYESNAREVAVDIAEMGLLASDRFRSLHPEASAEAVEALAWCYTYDYK